MAKQYEPETRISPKTGLPEHRHGDRNWHWSWSSHDGMNAETDPIHEGIFEADPRTPDQVKARLGHSESHMKGYVRRADRVKALKPEEVDPTLVV